jgi:O-antigen/teichoic acid export membrane protein
MMNLTKQNKQVVFLYGSTLIGVVLGILVSVLNTRNLNPTEFGDVRYVNNMMSFFSGLLLLGFFVSGSRLIAISKSNQNTAGIKGAMVIILIITILIMALLMIVSAFVHYKWLNANVSTLLLVAVPISASPLLLEYINTTAQGDNNIFSISMARLLPSLVYLIIAFLVYKYFGATSERMVLLQNGIAVVILAIIIYFSRPSFKYLKSSIERLKKENKKYGIQVYYGSITGVTLSYLAGITLGLFNTDNTSVGFYTLALTISTPLSMLPTIIGTTYFKRFAMESNISPKILMGSIILSLLSLLVFVILINPIVGLLYDKSYSAVAVYASLLAIGTTINGFGNMFNRFLGAHGQGKTLRNSAFICGAILVIGNFLFVYLWDIKGAIVTQILSSVGYCSTLIYYYYQFLRKAE